MGVTAVRPDEGMASAIAAAYEAAGKISFEGMHFRRDIGARAVAKPFGIK
jgi:phosphoribosylamine--glycine ligase